MCSFFSSLRVFSKEDWSMVSVGDDSAMIDEMSIVDVFTKLIFDADSFLNDTEILILESLCDVECSLLNASRRDLSEYLRSMGVDEMISIVGMVKNVLDQQRSLLTVNKRPPRHIFRR
jgi:hypothetical protein